jgi:uncharacterized protein
MSYIIDGRQINKDRHLDNRKKFIDRHKHHIKDVLSRDTGDRHLGPRKSITDDSGTKKIKVDSTEEPHIVYDRNSPKKHVLPGNIYDKGDILKKPNGGRGQKSGGGNEESTENYIYLSKKELIELYFENMELPNRTKTSRELEEYKLKVLGYTKYGAPPLLHIKKTFEQAIARRIANRSADYKPVYLCEEDLRYINKSKVKINSKKTVMFCLLDVSGSMTERHRTIAHRHFYLLYLFLCKFYEKIEVVFIIYDTAAEEVSEQKFFSTYRMGGTTSSVALDKVAEIMKERYIDNGINFYLSHASDGDNWREDDDLFVKKITELAPLFQYITYTDIGRAYSEYDDYGPSALCSIYANLKKSINNISLSAVVNIEDVYSELKRNFGTRSK